MCLSVLGEVIVRCLFCLRFVLLLVCWWGGYSFGNARGGRLFFLWVPILKDVDAF